MSSSSTVNHKHYFDLPAFVVVGASNEKAKFGNKVLRAYQLKGYPVTPINKKVPTIEGLSCEASLTAYAEKHRDKVCQIGVSVVTPPAVTQGVVEEGLSLGYKHFFFQPGTLNEQVSAFLQAAKKDGKVETVIDDSCVLVELNIEDPHHF
eukprot:gene10223-11315_t